MDREKFIKNIVDNYKPPENLLISVTARFGKTYLAIQLIDKLYNLNKNCKVLFVTPNTQLRDIAIPNEFEKWNYKYLLSNTTCICYSSLHKLTGNYDLIILDEVQRISEISLTNIFNKTLNTKSFIAMTGTLPKKKDKKELLSQLGIYSCKRYEYSMDKAIENNIISDYEVYLIPNYLNTTDKNIKSGNKQNTFYQTELAKYTYLNNKANATSNFNDILNRMRFLQTLPSKRNLLNKILPHFKDKRGLIFSANIEIASSLNIPTYHSKTNDNNLIKFQNKEINQLSLVNAGGVGFTYTDIDFVILHQIDSNKLGNSLQKLSRSLIYRECCIPKIYILYTKDTQEEVWLESFLDSLDKSKIKIINI